MRRSIDTEDEDAANLRRAGCGSAGSGDGLGQGAEAEIRRHRRSLLHRRCAGPRGVPTGGPAQDLPVRPEHRLRQQHPGPEISGLPADLPAAGRGLRGPFPQRGVQVPGGRRRADRGLHRLRLRGDGDGRGRGRRTGAPRAGARDGLPGTGGTGPRRGGQLSPKCAGMQRKAKCWRELTNKPGCYAHSRSYSPRTKWAWSGACEGGVAVGQGTIVWTWPGDSSNATGILVRGKRHGRWVVRYNSRKIRHDRRTGELVLTKEKVPVCYTRQWDHGKALSVGKTRPGRDC